MNDLISRRISILALSIAISLGCNSGFANQLFDDAESRGVNSSCFEDSLGSNLFEETDEDILVGSLDGTKRSVKQPTKKTLRATKVTRSQSLRQSEKTIAEKKENPVKTVKLKAVPVGRVQSSAVKNIGENRKKVALNRLRKDDGISKRKIVLPEDPITLGFTDSNKDNRKRLKAAPVKKSKVSVKENQKDTKQQKLVAQKEYGNPEVFSEEYLNGLGEKKSLNISKNKELISVTEERDKLLKEREKLVALIKDQQDYIDEQAEIYEKAKAKTENKPLIVEYEGSRSKAVKDVPMPDPLVEETATVRDYKEEVSSIMGNGYTYKDTESVSKITNEPTLREQSEYQLLDYVNGMMNTIYTKVGYTTVVILPAGEKLERVTIGDRQRFNVSTVFDKSSGSWHIYLQPVQMNVTTNMVIATDRHLFNATLGTSEFFKPFVKWINVPGAVESVAVQDGALDLAVKDVDALNFKYKRSGDTDSSWTPLNIFDDKNGHTFISFDGKALVKYHPVVLTKDITGDVKLVPYSRYKNTFIIDNIYGNLEVRVNDKSVVYVRKN